MTTLIERLEANAARHPDKAVFIYPVNGMWTTVTYAQLLDSTRRFTSGLLACHAVPGMRAALMTPPSADFFALTFALLKLGIIPILVDPAIGLKKVSECLKESQPDIFIGNTLTHALRIGFGWGRDSIKLNVTIEKIKNVESRTSKVKDLIPNSLIPNHLIPESPAAIIYTSGSTGLPKGAVYTQANFAAQMDMLADTFNITPDEVHAIQRFNVTNMFASPVVLDILERFWSSKKIQQQAVGLHNGLDSLKRIITAGAPAPIQLQEKFRKLLNDKTDLFGIYGATEALPIAKIESRELFELKEKTANGAGICLGRPVTGAQVRVIQITDSVIAQWQSQLEVPPNVVGEITVTGAAVTGSYVAREEATQLAKIRDGAEIIHRMGDVGYFDEQGRLWYCGRKSHRVVTQDGVLFTEQIEGIFNAHPLVYRTALVGVQGKPVLWVETVKLSGKESSPQSHKDSRTQRKKTLWLRP
ncbi:MAG: AMP-binding protein [Anaerolineales bacterium]|nr:AMP-binding protein [Anaerolineales bacterium]